MQISFNQSELRYEWESFKYECSRFQLKIRELWVRLKYAFWIIVDPFDYPKANNLVDSIALLPKHQALRAIEYYQVVEFQHEYDIEVRPELAARFKPKQLSSYIQFLKSHNKTTLQLQLLKERLETE